jgi:hypothetical protein
VNISHESFIAAMQLKCSTNQLNRICSVTKKISWWFYNGMSVHMKWLSARGNTVNLIGIARKIVHVLKKTHVEKCVCCVKMQISLTKYTKYSITIYSTNQVGIYICKSRQRGYFGAEIVECHPFIPVTMQTTQLPW